MPTTRGWVLAGMCVLLALLGAALGVEEFVLLALAGTVLLVLCAPAVHWRARRARSSLRISVDVAVPEASVGDVVTARVVVGAEGSGLSGITIEDPARCWSLSHPGLGGRPSPPGPRPGADDVAPGRAARRAARRAAAHSGRRSGRTVARPVRDVPAGERVAVKAPVPTSRRGVVTMSGPKAWCRDAFGLFALAVGEGPGARLIVVPVPGEPRSAARDAERVPGPRPGASSRPVSASARLAGDELDWLRPYVPGDRLTRLHWQALARTGDLVVREFTAGDAGRLTLLVDVRPGADPAALEAAISAAAGMGVRALADGLAVELCTSAGERVAVMPSASGSRDLLRALAMVGPTRPRRDEAMRWNAHSTGGALWATDNLADAGQVFVTARAGGDDALPDALVGRTTVVVVR